MSQDEGQAPPPGFMDGPESYDLEELIHISRLEAELQRLLEQILSVDPNGMMRIEIILQKVRMSSVVERRLH